MDGNRAPSGVREPPAQPADVSEGLGSFWRVAQAHPERVAIIDPSGDIVTYGALYESCNRVSNGLVAMGLQPGDGIAAALPNDHLILEVYLAALQVGLYFTPINYHLTSEEMAYVVRDSEARVLFTDATIGAAREAAKSAGLGDEQCLARGGLGGFRDLEIWMASQSSSPPERRRAGQRMLYTSGTSGRPKGVRRGLPATGADEAAATAARAHRRVYRWRETGSVHLIPGPLYHAAPLAYAIHSLHLGQTVPIMGRYDSEEMLALIERYRVSSVHLVPTMMVRLLRLPDELKSRYDRSSLQQVLHAAAPCPPDVKRQMLDWWGPIIDEYYAASEGGGTFVAAEEWLRRPGTVGRPHPPNEVRILREDGSRADTLEPGRLYFKLLEDFAYFKDPEKTEANRQGEWFWVGDIGYVDADGFVYLCDRSADTIISGGVNIYPAEVEAVLLTHPAVLDVAVIGVPDDEFGEAVKAVVQPSGLTARPSDRELMAYCRARLAHFKCPRSVEFRPELPRYDSGKLYRRRLRDEYWKGVNRRI
jgi:long-chain acyl-CoA synthetase